MSVKLLNNVTDLSKSSFANLKELADINAKTFEALSEQQIALLGTFADVADKQVELVGEIKSYQEALAVQSEMAAEVSSKLMELANGTSDILTQSKEELSAWAEKTVKGSTDAATAVVKQVAKTAAEAVA